MIYRSVLAVQAEGVEEACGQAEEFLAMYEHQVWDWYELGGAWKEYLRGSFTAVASSDPEWFLSTVDELVERRWGRMREMRRHLAGPDGRTEMLLLLNSEDAEELGKDAELLGKAEELYRQHASVFDQVMQAERFDDEQFEVMGYRIMRFGRLLTGSFVEESLFYDTVVHDPGVDALRERVQVDPSRQWLVVAQLHK